MKNYRVLPCCAVLLAVIVLAGGCSSGPSEEELALAAMQEQAQAINTAYETLTQQRAELDAAETAIAEIEGISKRSRTDEQNQQLEELTAKLPELQESIDTGYNDVQEKLADYLFLALNDFPEAPETQEGLRIYADEAIFNAEDTVTKSGNYNKGMETMITAKEYYVAIGLEPLPMLVDKIAEYEDWRFITKERFDQVKRNMTPDEVKEVVGVPYYKNIRENPNKTITWIYGRREGGAAAITFNTKGKVYHTNFDAVKPKVAD
jgi:outer membrane murein-binding lipoprotein Lpp